MKIIFAALVVVFAVGFASPSFADDEPIVLVPLADEFNLLLNELSEGDAEKAQALAEKRAEQAEKRDEQAKAKLDDTLAKLAKMAEQGIQAKQAARSEVAAKSMSWRINNPEAAAKAKARAETEAKRLVEAKTERDKLAVEEAERRKVLAAAKRAAKAQLEVNLMAEQQTLQRRAKSRLKNFLALPIAPENHCEAAKAMLAGAASALFFSMKANNVTSFRDEAEVEFFTTGVQNIGNIASLKMAVCENYY